jgi:DNA-binding SARP family transcriptional activator
MIAPDLVPSPLTLRLFGPFEALRHGEPLPRVRVRKGHWLLALLILRHGGEVDRSWLAGTLWPDSRQSQAFSSLRSMIAAVREALGPDAQRLGSPTAHTLTLDLTGTQVDLLDFDAAIGQGDEPSLQQAVSLYRGRLLEECTEEWVIQERQAREQAYLDALERLAASALAREETQAAERYLRQAVAADPLRESAQRALMQALAAGGSYAAALQTYRELRLLLHRELNAEPDPETKALFHSLRESAREERTPPCLPAGAAEVSIREPQTAAAEPVGGAVPLDSPFYVVRPADAAFQEAISRQDSIVLVKGAHQTGKTSLLARGLQQARQAGARVALTDFQTLNASHLETVERFLLALAQQLAVELELDVWPQEVWKAGAAPSLNFDLYLRRYVFSRIDAPIIWSLDGVDRLFACEFGNEVFGMFRSWHDRRYLHPQGAWSRLTLAMAYATEAHLFITDLKQSPFNVGTRLELSDFTRDQVADLNERYCRPLRSAEEVERFYRLVSGQPYLVRRGLHGMTTLGLDINALEAQAERDHGLFGDPLRRLLALLLKDPGLSDVVRGVLRGQPCPTLESFYRLRAAGVLTGEAVHEAALRCHLYERYLAARLL